jgi:Protein of unknown function (DUF3017)
VTAGQGPDEPLGATPSGGDRPASRPRSDPALPAGADPFLADRREEDEALEVARALAAREPRLQWPLMVVLVGMVVSLVVVATDHFRRGSVLLAGFVVLAFFLRLILSNSDAGWLAVRSRAIDLAVLGTLGTSLSVFALVVPPPS